MIFITGGIYSGRHIFAKKLIQDLSQKMQKNISNIMDIDKKLLHEYTIFTTLIQYRITHADIIIGTQDDCTIVAMNKSKTFQELNGKVCQFCATNASVVIRMLCGIPIIIKGRF